MPFTSSGGIRALFPTIRNLGYEPQLALKAIGLSVNENTASSNWMFDEPEDLDQFLELVFRHTVPHLGLEMGRRARLDRVGLGGYLVLNSSTLEEALALLTRTANLYDSFRTELSIGEHDAVITIDTRFPELRNAHFFTERRFAFICEFMRRLFGESWNPSALQFTHKEPTYVDEYHRFFCCTVEFLQPRNALILPAEQLSRPIPKADRELQVILRANLDELEAENRPVEYFVYRVGMAIATLLKQGQASMELVAKELALSKRSLQRRLKDRGVNYQKIVDEEKKIVAMELLRTSNSSTAEIAKCLGYSDTSAFSRAFRRWTSVSPRTYRKLNSDPKA